MINRVDFSANAPVYDIRHGALLPDHVAGALTTRLKPGARILDVGAGTGRVSVSFARIGFDVVAIEPAPGMLQALREKAGALSIPCIAAEGSRLPFQNRIADAVVISRLLYLVPGWQGLLRAVSDVPPNHGPILHEWGTVWMTNRGSSFAKRPERFLRRPEFETLFTPGARTEQEVDQYLAELGFAGGSGWRPVQVQPFPFQISSTRYKAARFPTYEASPERSQCLLAATSSLGREAVRSWESKANVG